METSSLPNVLFVDDEETNLNLLKYVFRKKVNVFTADSGERALKLLENNKQIIMIVTDMRMPGMNGLELIREVKAQYAGIHCLLLSGFDRNAEIDNALEDGLIVAYLSKPFNKEQLLRFIYSAAAGPA